MKPDDDDELLPSEAYTWRIVGILVLMVIVIALQDEMELAVLDLIRTWLPAPTT